MKKRYIFISLVLLIIAFIWMNFFSNQATAIGIIGGADGPTAIFLVGKTPPSMLVGLVTLICLIVGLVIWSKKR